MKNAHLLNNLTARGTVFACTQPLATEPTDNLDAALHSENFESLPRKSTTGYKKGDLQSMTLRIAGDEGWVVQSSRNGFSRRIRARFNPSSVLPEHFLFEIAEGINFSSQPQRQPWIS